MLEFLIHGVEVLTELAVCFHAIAGGDEVGGNELHLRVEVLGLGATGEQEGLIAGAEVHAHRLAGQNAAKVIRAVLLQTTRLEHALRIAEHAGLVFRCLQLSTTEADQHTNAAFLKGRGLDV